MADLLSYALCTVADVKELLGIPDSDTSKDNLIKRKINQATEMIERYTGRRFKETTYTEEEYDATNTDQLILRQRPVTAVSGFGARDTSLNDSDWSDIDSDLFFSSLPNNSGVIDANFGLTGHWNRYRITYTAGYSTIPADLAEACAQLAAFLVDNGTSGTNVKSKQEGQRKIEYFDSNSAGGGSQSLFNQLGIDEILISYSNYPLLADK